LALSPQSSALSKPQSHTHHHIHKYFPRKLKNKHHPTLKGKVCLTLISAQNLLKPLENSMPRNEASWVVRIATMNPLLREGWHIYSSIMVGYTLEKNEILDLHPG
jgi:hypothetical protein